MSRPTASESNDRTEWVRQAVATHQRSLIRYVISLTGDSEAAQDIAQETFMRLCSQSKEALESHLGAWLFTVARNRALDYLRKGDRVSSLTDAQLESRREESPNPADALETRETVNNVIALIDRLPKNQREVVRLKFQNQLSYQEISEVTTLSIGNVGFLLHTALRTLRHQLAQLDRRSRPARD